MTPFDNPRLIADIGGSYARFAVEAAPAVFGHVASIPCSAHPDFHSAVSAYLGSLPAALSSAIQHAAVAIA
ncbi:RpiR family transcriptional regulator, partial [Rubrivivax gelatinosus]|nr:RpiR family transcriptional regulator [Rubrivivax gelatinosus]